MKENKIIQHTIIIGFALFAVFFGAGNLIFPPTIGLASGTNWLPALIGFCITGIALPLLAVIAILNVGGKFEDLTKPISPWFYKIFNLLLMVGIGMFVTIPRMAATTHELGVKTLIPQVPSVVTIFVFFAVTFYFAMDKSNVIDKIGKFLTPLLVIILTFIVIKGVFDPIGSPISTELKNPFSNAFINAYQTGDVVTGIFCAPIIIAAIIGHGYKGASMKKVAISATAIAGIGLLVVYGGLLYLGAAGSGLYPNDIESTALVSALINRLLGSYGAVLLAITIALACLTSAIGVTAVIGDFLRDISNNKISYRNGALLVCVVGAAIGMLGVEKIINYTLPIFLALYPVAIVLVFLGVFHKVIPNPGSYRGAILLTFIVSLFETLGAIGIKIPAALNFIPFLPFSANGFSWLVPAIIGAVFGTMIYRLGSKKHNQVSFIEPEKHS
ncbi:branched-chain amino acid transport system II carrier protein [Neobacillus kokaensis]|uniref:Branched-chain amino acid transport system carrier protein n=1 Tax=Neobacillus kokaensis TaxID=2759023 RepID=A0ABQ3N289_9BACI|nr:branched-chain amino acid transport system II carrier protein [Neobacillus kokaensis]GHH99059.1 branched-chain amino acid transport system carrier protein [Neobacillus kokaensis]